jgi:hypothetical protein
MRRMVEKLTAAGWLLAFQGFAALLEARVDDVAQQLRACCARWEAEKGRQARVEAQPAAVCAQASAGAPQAAQQQGHSRAASAASAAASAAWGDAPSSTDSSAQAAGHTAAGSTAAAAPATTAEGDTDVLSAVAAGSAAAAAVLHTAGHVRTLEEGAALVVPEPDVLAALHGEGECPAAGVQLWQLVLEQWEVYRCVLAGCKLAGHAHCTAACVHA